MEQGARGPGTPRFARNSSNLRNEMPSSGQSANHPRKRGEGGGNPTTEGAKSGLTPALSMHCQGQT